MRKLLLWALLCLMPLAGCGNGDGKTTKVGSGNGDSTDTTDGDGSDGTNGNSHIGDTTTGNIGDTATGGNFDECADIPWQVENQPINLLVILDRSGSMQQNMIGAQSYAQVVQDAIDQIVEQNTKSGIINFALNLFPAPSQCPDNSSTPAVEFACAATSNFIDDATTYEDPTVTFTPQVTMDTYDLIADALATADQCGGTPIRRSLQWAKSYLDSQTLTGRTFVLLATDGAPNCYPLDESKINTCTNTMGSGKASFPEQCLDDAGSINAAIQLGNKGYLTYVVGVGDEVKAYEAVLDKIAFYAGGHGSVYTPAASGTWYYPAGSADQLSLALEDITNKNISCEFDVPWSEVPDVDPNDPNQPISKSCDGVRVKAIIDALSGAAMPMLDTDSMSMLDTNAMSGDSASSSEVGTDSATTPASTGLDVDYDISCKEPVKQDDNGNDVQHYGWNWADDGMSGLPWSEVERINDTTKCTRIKLCPKACDQLKTHGGQRTWETVSASFGCQPVIIIQ